MTTRRDFIKITGLGIGGLTLASASYKALANTFLKDGLEKSMYRTPTYCEVCFWKCAGWVYKNEEGKIWKIEGNHEDQHSNGRLCPRGTGGVGMYYDEDRLKTPLIRTEERGKQTFREATWEEAFDLISEKLLEVKEKYGPEALALFTHGSGGAFWSPFAKAFGTDSIAAPAYGQCLGPRETAFISTFGEGIESPEPTDIRDTKCLVLIGSHIGENMHNGQVQEMSDAIDKGATIITVDPRFSTAASKSKFWLPIKPSTDIALLMAWIHVLINEGWYDKEYVEKYTYGFDLLKQHVQNMTPEWAYGITTIKPDVIRQTAKEMFNASPSVIVHPGRHVVWYGDDTQRLRAVAILNALLGSWGRRGGFYRPDITAVPGYPQPPFPKPKRSWKDLFPGKYPMAGLGLANVLIDGSIPSDDHDFNIKAWIVNATNLIQSVPDQAKTIKAIQNLDFIVAIDTMPMEITGWADVVLPECTYIERYDAIRNAQHRKPAVALRMPATEPLYDSKPAWWMVKNLAEKMGMGEYFPWKDVEELLDWQFKQIGTSLEEMQKVGVKTFPRAYDDLYFKDGEEREFYTNTGKIELYSTDMAANGQEPMPTYKPHEEPPAGFYRLLYGRNPDHTFGRTINNPNLNAIFSENVVWVNPKVAKEWGLTNGQDVWLKNQDGIVSDFPIKVRVTERIRWDSVYMIHGFGHTEKKLSRAYGKGAGDSQLITRVHTDPAMGATGMRGNFVTFLFEPEA